MSQFAATSLTDRELVSRILGGDRALFTTLVHNTEGLVAKIVCNLIDNVEDRRDVAQEVYLKVYRKLDTFAFQARLTTWIGQIAYHTAINHMRGKRLSLHDDMSGFTMADDAASPELRATRNDLAALLHDKLEQLPEMQRMLIGLYHQQGLSYEEIMDITGLPEGTLKNYLFRARKALKEKLLSSYKKDAL